MGSPKLLVHPRVQVCNLDLSCWLDSGKTNRPEANHKQSPITGDILLSLHLLVEPSKLFRLGDKPDTASCDC